MICHHRALVFSYILASISCNIRRDCIQSLSHASANEANVCSNMRWDLECYTENKKMWLKVAHSIVIMCAFSAIYIYLVLKEQRPKEKEDAHHQSVLECDFWCLVWFRRVLFLPALTLLVKQTLCVTLVIKFHVDAPFPYHFSPQTFPIRLWLQFVFASYPTSSYMPSHWFSFFCLKLYKKQQFILKMLEGCLFCWVWLKGSGIIDLVK